MKCKCGKPVETRSGLKYPLCYDCWWAQDPRNEAKPAPPPASLEDEERAEAWADQFSEPKTHGPAARLVAKASALWGLRTSAAELLAEREKVRRLRGALRKCAEHALRETNRKREYERDTYGVILDIARKGMKEAE